MSGLLFDRGRALITLSMGLTVALLLLTACAAEIDRNGRSSTAEAEVSTLRIYYQGNETVFGPADWVSYRHIVFASLFRTGPDGDVGWLVDRWEVSEDGRTCRTRRRTRTRGVTVRDSRSGSQKRMR